MFGVRILFAKCPDVAIAQIVRHHEAMFGRLSARLYHTAGNSQAPAATSKMGKNENDNFEHRRVPCRR